METIDKVVRQLGTADIDARLEELLIDGILYAYQEQVGWSLQESRCSTGISCVQACWVPWLKSTRRSTDWRSSCTCTVR